MDFLANHLEALLKGSDVSISASQVTQFLLDIVTLNIHHQYIGKTQGVIGEGGCKGALFNDTSFDQWCHFWVFGLYGALSPIEQRNLPETACTGSLHANDEFIGLSGFLVHRVGHHTGHYRAYKAQAHYHDNFVTLGSFLVDQLFQSLVFLLIICLLRQSELFTFRTYGVIHGFPPINVMKS